ncbi:hypothetical protein PDESU_01211 [Pontiella desulfatans]|uniref:Uncharacterized protein n=1 Tax=Pontiella desulfatans TaxID=2750659 RepID=A0A6C2TY48_PONDE|nr:hypothetical protein PDESU_01211 [Pontiella desulfatans]
MRQSSANKIWHFNLQSTFRVVYIFNYLPDTSVMIYCFKIEWSIYRLDWREAILSIPYC